MKKLFIAVSVYMLLPFFVYTQSRHDANWCFGYGAGIHFNEDSTSSIFNCSTQNMESCASFSSNQGDLMFYSVVEALTDLNVRLESSIDLPILNNDSFLINSTVTNGGMFIPNFDKDTVWFYYLGEDIDSSNAGSFVLNLMTAGISVRNDSAFVFKKNEIIVHGPLQEKMAVTRSIEKNCWWIVTHRNIIPCNNEFVLIKVCEGVVVDSIVQSIGTVTCNQSNFFGEMLFSDDGDLLIFPLADRGKIEIYNFNRCSGEFILNRTVSGFRTSNAIIYGVEYSDEFVYISEPGDHSDTSIIYQYSLGDSILREIYRFDSLTYQSWALEKAWNGKIYLSHCGRICNNGQTNNSTQCLSVIHNPDQIGSACNFEPFGFCFPDSIKMNAGLPNFPNYDLPPDPVFTADAGRDTTLCRDDGTSVLLGSPPVPNIIYSWQPATFLSATNIAQPIANPTNGQLTVELLGTGSGTITFFNLLGQHVYNALLNPRETTLSFDLPQGVYIYRIEQDGKYLNGKLVVE